MWSMNYLRHGSILAILIVCLLVACRILHLTKSSATGSGQLVAVTTPAASQGSILVYAVRRSEGTAG